jgi:hypothetical protein
MKFLTSGGTLRVIRQPSPLSLAAGYGERVKDLLKIFLPGRQACLAISRAGRAVTLASSSAPGLACTATGFDFDSARCGTRKPAGGGERYLRHGGIEWTPQG